MMRYYSSSLIFAVLAIIGGYWIGGLSAAFLVAILGVLEVSLSFDNAVVNASVLQNWDQKWRRRFLVWGMPIAVFGMRLVFPLVIVAVVAKINPIAALMMALNNPDQYATTLTSAHHQVASFGGTFLMLVFLNYFVDKEKDTHWIGGLEHVLSYLGKGSWFVHPAIVTCVIMAVTSQFDRPESSTIIWSALSGGAVYYGVKLLGTLTGGGDDDSGTKVIKQGIGGFLYLEVVDASFSFDGVIGAFALSTNFLIIMLGLSVGAFFVRSMTLHLVDKGTLQELKYLEHSAFWAIGVLATIMMLSMTHDVSEVVTGLLGAILIVCGVIHSLVVNKREAVAS